MTTTTTITLTAGGERTRVEEAEAKEIAERFARELDQGGSVVVCNKVDLSCRSWPRASLECLRSVLTRVAPTVEVLKLDDIIASLDTDAGLSSLEFFSTIFHESTVLAEIDLKDNALGTRGDVVLGPLFRLQSLMKLNLYNCGMSKEVTESLLGTLSLPMTDLSLGRNQIDSQGAVHVGRLLAQCTAWQVFEYNGCRPLQSGTAHVLKGLATMARNSAGGTTALIRLDLDDCTVGEEPVEGVDDDDDSNRLSNLALVLRKSPSLQTLILQECAIGEGLGMVLTALEESGAQLQVLRLGGCELAEEGADTLMEAIASPKKHLAGLRELVLDTNELGDEKTATLVQAVAANCPHLQVLDLESNELGRDSAKALLQQRKQLSALQQLNLKENMDIPAKLAARLEKLYPTVQVDEDLEDDGEDDDDDVDDLADQLANTNI